MIALLLERGITAPQGRRKFADLLGTFVERQGWLIEITYPSADRRPSSGVADFG